MMRLLIPHAGRAFVAALLGLGVGLLGWTTAYYVQAALDARVTAGITAAVLTTLVVRGIACSASPSTPSSS